MCFHSAAHQPHTRHAIWVKMHDFGHDVARERRVQMHQGVARTINVSTSQIDFLILFKKRTVFNNCNINVQYLPQYLQSSFLYKKRKGNLYD